jgi:hypothetical protein
MPSGKEEMGSHLSCLAPLSLSLSLREHGAGHQGPWGTQADGQ